MAVDTFLGVMLHLSSATYNNSEAKYDGTINVDETDDKITYGMEVKGNAEDLKDKKSVHFQVKKPKK